MSNVTPLNVESGAAVRAIVPRDLAEAQELAHLVLASGMAPKGMDKPETIMVAMLHGLEVGLRPLQALQNIAVINGRPALWGDAALALVRSSGLLESFSEKPEGTGEAHGWRCTAQRRDEPAPITRLFTLSDAKRAGLWGKPGPWATYPERMLQMRARSWTLRDGFTDVLRGLHVAEEARDLPADAPSGTGGAGVRRGGCFVTTSSRISRSSSARRLACLA